MEDEKVRIVSVALPNFAHAELVGEALRATKHVLCEKPLALSVASGRELVALARRAGVVAGTGVNFRRYPAIKRYMDTMKRFAVSY